MNSQLSTIFATRQAGTGNYFVTISKPRLHTTSWGLRPAFCTSNGFSFMELLFVISIISILASLAIPSYHKYIKQAMWADAYQMIAPIQKNIAEYYAYYGYFPANNQAAGQPPAHQCSSTYVSSILIEEGAIHVQFGNKAAKELQGKIQSFRPALPKGSVTANLLWIEGKGVKPGNTEKQLDIYGRDKSTQ